MQSTSYTETDHALNKYGIDMVFRCVKLRHWPRNTELFACTKGVHLNTKRSPNISKWHHIQPKIAPSTFHPWKICPLYGHFVLRRFASRTVHLLGYSPSQAAVGEMRTCVRQTGRGARVRKCCARIMSRVWVALKFTHPPQARMHVRISPTPSQAQFIQRANLIVQNLCPNRPGGKRRGYTYNRKAQTYYYNVTRFKCQLQQCATYAVNPYEWETTKKRLKLLQNTLQHLKPYHTKWRNNNIQIVLG